MLSFSLSTINLPACLSVSIYLFAIHLSVCYEFSCYLYTYVRTLSHMYFCCILCPSVYCISAGLTERPPFCYLAACLTICFLPTYLPKATLLATYLLTWLSVCLSISLSICLHAYSTNGSQASSLDAHFRNKERGGRVGSQAHIRIAKNSISRLKKNVDNDFCLETSRHISHFLGPTCEPADSLWEALYSTTWCMEKISLPVLKQDTVASQNPPKPSWNNASYSQASLHKYYKLICHKQTNTPACWRIRVNNFGNSILQPYPVLSAVLQFLLCKMTPHKDIGATGEGLIVRKTL